MGAIFGFGEVVVNSIVFSNAVGILRYEQEMRVDAEKDSGELIRKRKGWRAYIDVEIPNFESTDQTNILNLIGDINFYDYFYIYPRFQSGYINILIIAELISDFAPEDLTKNNKGQFLNLKFKAKALSDSIPPIFYQEPVKSLLTENLENLTTESGDTLILEQ